jgi:hypothetical protein
MIMVDTSESGTRSRHIALLLAAQFGVSNPHLPTACAYPIYYHLLTPCIATVNIM